MFADINKIKEHFVGDEELVEELLDLFNSSYIDVISRLESAIESDEREKVKLEAHTLKGMLSNFFAEELKSMASDIEENCNTLSKEDLNSKVVALKENIPQMIEEIKNVKF